MNSKRLTIVLTVALLLMASVWAMSAFGQSDGATPKVVIQYKLVPVPGVMTQAQLQTVLTTQGNGGWRYVGPLAVGTGPIPDQEVILFSKP